ncbi:MAG: hypothetical protein QOG35_3181 [Solirubrobacteraceae bacterium]|jgi:hypothetical protein|nr:hypothetical protein [Solirubrobacteraceae bacterium]
MAPDENNGSGTPLPQKLGLKPGMVVAFLDAPDHLDALLGDLDGVTVRRRLRGRVDGVLCFVTARRDLERRAARLREAVAPDGMVWACWPKRASKVATDVTEDVVREVLLPTGLVDVKVAAIDETWSGLKLVVRRELR